MQKIRKVLKKSHKKDKKKVFNHNNINNKYVNKKYRTWHDYNLNETRHEETNPNKE